jgi:ribosome-associated protein
MLFVSPEIQIPDAELEFTFVRSSGPGGQAVNKVNSKAQLRWNFQSSSLPWPVRQRFLERFAGRLTNSGDLLIASDRFRDRLQNQADCLDKLRGLLLLVARPPKPRKKTKPTRGSRERAKVDKRKHGEKKKGRAKGGWE